MRGWLLMTLAAATLAPAQASGEIVARSDNGFTVRVAAEVVTSPDETWKALVQPAKWWLDEHTFSGSAANLSLDPVAGGCFCEKLPLPGDAPAGSRPGGVEHMRVIYVQQPKALRMSGALGPLQSEAVTGTLTVTLKPLAKGTRILWEYVVGGYMRYPQDKLAPAVDSVISAQLNNLAAKLGPVTTFELPQGEKRSAQGAPAPGEAKPEGPLPSQEDAHHKANEALDKALSPGGK
ncbi:MAG: SRPBCC family protein [Sphingomonadales bacterium]|nr:SRPBCC family protein [Sphingomonadales bacterium]MDE2570382.1 SRPBCC family protein [Sphingomonadales bacterium]